MPILAAKEQEVKRLEWDLDEGDIMPLRMVIGTAFEYYFAGFYPDMMWQPGEFEVDGILGHPDGYHFADYIAHADYKRGMAVDEFKFTWKSCRTREVLKESLWMWQAKGYCYMLGAELGRMHVCWSNGEYNHTYQPRYRKTLIRFTPEELKRNWDMIYAAKERSVIWNQENPRT